MIQYRDMDTGPKIVRTVIAIIGGLIFLFIAYFVLWSTGVLPYGYAFIHNRLALERTIGEIECGRIQVQHVRKNELYAIMTNWGPDIVDDSTTYDKLKLVNEAGAHTTITISGYGAFFRVRGEPVSIDEIYTKRRGYAGDPALTPFEAAHYIEVYPPTSPFPEFPYSLLEERIEAEAPIFIGIPQSFINAEAFADLKACSAFPLFTGSIFSSLRKPYLIFYLQEQ